MNTAGSDSLAITMLRAFYEAGQRVSAREFGYGMGKALTACFHLGLRFEKNDIEVFARSLGGNEAFGAGGGEGYYTDAIEIGNDSACRSFEAFFNRPPFIYNGKRLHIGSHVRWENQWVTITSFSGHGDTAVVVACSYTYTRSVYLGDRRCERKIDRRFRLTLNDVREAEKLRVAALRHDNLVKEVGQKLDDWSTSHDRGEMRFFVEHLTTEQLQEAQAWCKANERLLYGGGDQKRAAALAAAPASVREPLTAHKRDKHRRRARAEIETAVRKLHHASEWARVEVAESEIDARLAGDSIADILAKGTMVSCGECDGKGKTTCGACGNDYVTCHACEGKRRIPAPKHAPDKVDYEALCGTLGVRVEAGEIVLTEEQGDLSPRAHLADQKRPKRSKAALVAEASENIIREAAYLSSPKRRAAVRKAVGK